MRSAAVQWARRPAVGARLFCRPREPLGASRSVEVGLICGVCVPSGACGSDGAPWGVCVAFDTPARSHANVVTPRWVRALLPSACPGLPIANELWAGCRQSDVSRRFPHVRCRAGRYGDHRSCLTFCLMTAHCHAVAFSVHRSAIHGNRETAVRLGGIACPSGSSVGSKRHI